MKIVYSYHDDFSETPGEIGLAHPDRLAKMHGRNFRSYNQIIGQLLPGDCVTVQSDRGFKQVGIDKNSRGWVQRNFSYEY